MLLRSFGHQATFRGQVKKCYKLASGASHRRFRQHVIAGTKKIHGGRPPIGHITRCLDGWVRETLRGFNTNNVLKTTHGANKFVKERELFWAHVTC